MPDLKLIKNPGYVYDLMFVFYYKFNADLIPEKFYINGENMSWFSEEMKAFEPIPDDLYIFFRLSPTKRCFLSINYFDNYSNLFKTEYDLAFLQKELSDHDLFIKNVIRHYFDDLNGEQVNECLTSNKYVFDQIKKSDYDDKLKSKLYEFFVDPESYIRLLQYELMAKDILLSSYYEKNYSKILDAYNELNYESLRERVAPILSGSGYETNSANISLSFCLLNKYLLRFNSYADGPIYLFGVDYLASIERSTKNLIDPDPEQFGAALADSSRVKMLEIILQKGKCTRKDLEAALGIPASTAYHHASTLEKCGLVRATISKKTQLYSINKKYFSAIIDYLKKFSE
jgi:DNA-binding transcriptional ArsR family regulator